MKEKAFTGNKENFETKNENYEELEKVSKKWSLKSIAIFSLLCCVNFTEFSAYSILASFFPVEAVKMGASKFAVGVIFSSYALVGFISSPFIGLLVPKFGCKVLIVTGLSVVALGQFGFMFATMLPKGAAFVGYSLMFRIISALGAITCDTAALSLVTQEFPDAVGLSIGLLEVFTGLGLGAGPVIGGYLFAVEGFKGPFIGITCLVVVVTILVYIFIPGAAKGSKEELKIGPLKQALGIVDVLFGAEVTVASMFLVVALDPILSLFAEHVLQINAIIIGVLFAVFSFFYLLTTIIAGRMIDKAYIPLVCAGFLVMAVGYLLVGPAPFLTFVPTGNLWLVGVSMMMIGVGAGSSIIPLMPFLLNAAMDNGMPDNLATSSVISGLFMSSCSFGQFVAPLASAAVFQELGFGWTSAIFAFMCFAQVMLMAIYEICSRIRSNRKSKEKGRYRQLGTEEQYEKEEKLCNGF